MGKSHRCLFFILSAVMLSACGGSDTSVSFVPELVAPPSQAPTANAVIGFSTITEGGMITASATDSTDPQDDPLTFTWEQIAGPSVLPSATLSAETITVSALDVTENTELTFQLTVSDGTNVDTDTVSVIVEPLSAPVVTLPSSAEEGDSIEIVGISDSAEGDYTVYWGGDATSFQSFSADGVPLDIDTEFFALPEVLGVAPSESISDIVQSGATIFSIFVNSQQGPLIIPDGEGGFTLNGAALLAFDTDISTLQRTVNTDFNAMRDVFFTNSGSPEFRAFPLNAHAPIGQENLLSLISTSDKVDAIITQSNGVAIATINLADSGPNDVTDNVAVAAFGDGNIVGFWRVTDSDLSTSNVIMQRATPNNDLLGEAVVVGSVPLFEPEQASVVDPNQVSFVDPDVVGVSLVAFSPSAAQLSSGQVLVTWTEGENLPLAIQAVGGPFASVFRMRVFPLKVMGRIVNPDGSFASEAVQVLGLPEDGNENNDVLSFSPSGVLPLNSGEALVYWHSAEGILARVVASDGTLASDEFLLITAAQVDTEAVSSLRSSASLPQISAYQLDNGEVVIARDNLSVTFSPVGSGP